MEFSVTARNFYRSCAKYPGKVMFSLCLSLHQGGRRRRVEGGGRGTPVRPTSGRREGYLVRPASVGGEGYLVRRSAGEGGDGVPYVLSRGTPPSPLLPPSLSPLSPSPTLLSPFLPLPNNFLQGVSMN